MDKTLRCAWAAAGVAASLAAAGCDDKLGDSGGGGGDINLTVVSVLCTNSGGAAECEVLVENTGESGSGSFRVGVFVSSSEPGASASPDDATTINNLAPGAVQGVSLTASGGAGQTIWGVVDFSDEIYETYEDDNAASTTAVRR